jgi:Family of unknown function (DUF5522)
MPNGAVSSPAEAIAAAHEWFERHSGWAPPDHVTIAEWISDGVCRAPDECLVAPDAWCEHGLASWWLILTAPRRGGPPEAWDPGLLLPHPGRLDLRQPGAAAAIDAHEEAVAAGQAGYTDPGSGMFVMTARYHWERGSCCESGCRHCPYVAIVDGPPS